MQVYPLRGKESRQDRTGEWLKYPQKLKRLVLFIYSTICCLCITLTIGYQ
nr:MAG TPA: hypothetical protein [Caudoviricetes sp.]